MYMKTTSSLTWTEHVDIYKETFLSQSNSPTNLWLYFVRIPLCSLSVSSGGIVYNTSSDILPHIYKIIYSIIDVSTFKGHIYFHGDLFLIFFLFSSIYYIVDRKGDIRYVKQFQRMGFKQHFSFHFSWKTLLNITLYEHPCKDNESR